MATETRKIIDPNGVLVGGLRYPQGTPLTEVKGATDAQIKVWERFGQISKDSAPEKEKGATGK